MSATNEIPLSYTTPPFPSLYWPFDSSPGEPKYLYTVTDIWRFTLYWTLIAIPAAHFLVALWAILMYSLNAYRRHLYLKSSPSSAAAFHRESVDTDENDNDDDPITEDKDEGKGKGRARDYGERTLQLSAKNRKLLGERPLRDALNAVGMIMGVYMVIGGVEALVAGSMVGLVLGAVYNAGYFRMSTWTPLFWGIINMLVLILSSFRISGGL